MEEEPESSVGAHTDRSQAEGAMTEKDHRESGFIIDIFGLPLVNIYIVLPRQMY